MSVTDKYEKFKILKQNRNLTRSHINQLKDSITKHGYITSNPIIVDENMNIVDGQHRFIACVEMGLPIYYEIINDAESLLIDLNAIQKKWSANDYLKYYAQKYDNKNYIRVLDLMKKYHTTAETVFIIGLGKKSSGNLSKTIRNGELIFTKEDALKVENQFKNISTVIKNIKMKATGRLIQGLIEISKLINFKWNKMIDQSIKYPTVAYNCRTAVEYAVMLRDLYNFNTRKVETRI